jgi:Alr-MurF fusion protein
MPVYQMKEIAAILQGEVSGNPDQVVRQIITDSRTFINPEGAVFFAIKGSRHDGHQYIPELYRKGVMNFVVSSHGFFEEIKDACFIVVPNTLDALQQLASHHRKQFDIPVIGITGSNGKTIVKEWLFQLMQQDKKIIRSPKSYNSQIGVPLSVWQMDETHELAIFEAGISEAGEMQKLKRMIEPTIGIFTNIGDPHQANFMDYKHKISEKLKLFEQCEVLIYCKDYNLIENQIKSTGKFEDMRLFSWSQKFPADLFIHKIVKQSHYTQVSARFQQAEIDIDIPFTDDASIENAIHCWALMLLAYDNDEIRSKIRSLTNVAMRLELKDGINGCTIINDSYNSDTGSLSIALDFLNQQQQHTRKTLIISDILQSGKNETGLYKEIANLVSNKRVTRIIGIGEAISRNSHFFNIPGDYYLSTEAFLQNLRKESFRDEDILLKGSRSFEFERITNLLQQKTHRTILEINLKAIEHNLNYFKSLLLPGTKVMAMVKAFSYGSGTWEIANILQYNKVDYLGVAFADEGVDLRKAGINLPVLVLNPEEESFETMVEYNLEPEIYSFNTLRSFAEIVKKAGLDYYPVHIKLETGMNRLGFDESEIGSLIVELKSISQLIVKSVFSHLAASDESIHDGFTKEQTDQFERLSSVIQKEFNYHICRHLLNSGGLERFPEYQYDMVRLGIGLYGIGREEASLQNVSTLKTRISQIRWITAGETVGYSRQGRVTRNARIAVLPIGYSDGLDRRLSNGNGQVRINGSYAPFIGNICMDMSMVDITDILAEENDEAIIFDDEFPLSNMASALGTIPYEIMTSISKRVKRVYLYE